MRSALPLLALAALGATASAQTSFIFFGDTTNEPVFARPRGNAGSITRYEATEFQVDATGTYVGEMNAAFDPYLLVYQDSFNPLAPNDNLVNGDRTYVGDFSILPGAGTGQGPSTRAARIFAGEASDTNNEQFVRGAGLPLEAGRKYIAVATSFYADTDFAVTVFGFPSKGAYQIGIGDGPGNVSAFQPVPEPASMAALGLGALALLKRRRKV